MHSAISYLQLCRFLLYYSHNQEANMKINQKCVECNNKINYRNQIGGIWVRMGAWWCVKCMRRHRRENKAKWSVSC
jgi:hypothetical protein